MLTDLDAEPVPVEVWAVAIKFVGAVIEVVIDTPAWLLDQSTEFGVALQLIVKVKLVPAATLLGPLIEHVGAPGVEFAGTHTSVDPLIENDPQLGSSNVMLAACTGALWKKGASEAPASAQSA